VGDKVFRVAVVPAQMPAHVRPVGRARAPVAAAARARIPGLQRNPERPARQVEDGRPLAFVFHCFGGYIHWQPCQTAAGRRGFSGRNTMSSKAPRFVPSIRLARYDVINKKGEDLGQVQTFVVDMSEGIIAFALVAFGGFLGISDKWFAIPWEALKWHPTTNKFVLSMSEKVLKEAPGMDKDLWVEEIEKWQEERDLNLLDRYYTHHGYESYKGIVQERITSRGRHKVDAKFEINKDKAGEFRFRMVAVNGEVIAVSEGYTTKDNVLNGIASVKTNAAAAVIEDNTL
jgi:uncharacterized protein YegP (UPF0339 family)